MDLPGIFEGLVEIGRTGTFSDLSRLIGPDTHQDAVRLADIHRPALIQFAKSVTVADRVALVKAVATLEQSAGGLGSVTALQFLLPLLHGEERQTLDWILRNIDSYYYSLGARSIDEYDEACHQKAQRAAEEVRRDLERRSRRKARVADDATSKLYNAIRRGDVSAVQALLAKGANPRVAAPDGSPLLKFARERGVAAIVQHLEIALWKQHAP